MMKKMILFLCMAFMSILAYSQVRTESEVVLKNGASVFGYVTKQSDGSYKVENAAGDIFFFSESEVRRVKEMEMKRSINAQANSGQEVVYKRGGSIRFCSNGQKLTQEDFTSFKGWREYNGAKNLRGWGYGVAAIGLVAAGLGTTYWILWDERGGYAVAGGGAILAGGIAMIIVGNAKIKKIVKGYNNNPGYAIDFGVQQHGIGFAMTF